LEKPKAVLERFAKLANDEQDWQISEADLVAIATDISMTANLDDLDSRRAAFDALLASTDEKFGKSLPRDLVPSLRDRAVAGSPQGPELEAAPVEKLTGALVDAEIIAIYW
jgi:hypothetical protein